ncbi:MULTISPECIES: element excision factor XisH family protein [unclassified Microcoleus]|uniref:element excision factor XisH family protein n=1 Tax=unclassified Microcoleus TaxID=2642155 RepID=UPI002FD718DD
MAARDLFHDAVKKALQKEEWEITADRLIVKIQGVNYQPGSPGRIFRGDESER